MSEAAAPLTPSSLWWHATRPATLAASVSPVLIGIGIAARAGQARLAPSLGALGVAVALQVGVNYANDYSDHRRGADRIRVGPPRAASSGVVPPQAVLAAALVAFTVAAALGLWLAAISSWWLLAVGAGCILAAALYTGGPFPYGYHGYGEVAVFLFFGEVATCGTAFVEMRSVPLVAPLAAILPGALAASLLLINNIRDIETDREAGKRTLAVALGAVRARRLYLGLLALALAVPLILAIPAVTRAEVLLPWVVVPLFEGPVRKSGSQDPAALVSALKQTALVLLLSSLLLAVGIWMG
ncbi:MAG: 1,4-dihydroxy-2-naphthoate polyprenyltransferase [Candidatus Dormibacteraeota bacterium]|nr:1,4-dihydroxy-2-naphthoate polyprenyltransferase [Candidatus Dormibacteraeota bacterium]